MDIVAHTNGQKGAPKHGRRTFNGEGPTTCAKRPFATFWLLCDDFRTIHDPNPQANSWKRRETGTAWAQIAVTTNSCAPPNHLCTSLSLSDQLKAIRDTFGDGRMNNGRIGSRCRESM